MFGIRQEDRRRWDQAAERAGKIGQQIDDHVRECTQRYGSLNGSIDELKDANRWLIRGMVAVLLMVIAELLHFKGFW